MEYDGDDGEKKLEEDIIMASARVAALERELRIANRQLAKLENIKLEKKGIFAYTTRGMDKLTDFD